MKHLMRSLPAILIVLVFSCSKEVKDPPPPLPPPPPPPAVVADFTVTVTGAAPNASVTLVNNSTNADTYSWTFSQGANMDTSTQATPTGLTVDKKGDFTITLLAIKGFSANSITKTVSIGGTNPVFHYNDLKFGVHNYGTIPFCYAVAENKFYQRTEINSSNGPTIDLVFWKDGINSTSVFFSPHNPSYYSGFSIPGARVTQVINYQSAAQMQLSPEQFNGLVTDDTLAKLTIIDDNSLFMGNQQYLPQVKLFKTATGRKGAILIKKQETDHLLCEIKVQKY